ncbi:MAG TPA: hypothetical protein VK831_05590 [Candidatus Deferrimicrobiaceae bacterium]|nr:hypothetical protein [Candidatus Deferrimicrobiaceae bacterium]
MIRVLDRGAVTAAFVGIGMAVTLAISFLLVIPIDPVYLYLSLPAGVLIGYYANARSTRRRGEWRRIVPNALFAGLATGLTLAVLLLGVKALFFFGDSGFPDYTRRDEAGAVIPPTCEAGADCVYRRYLAAEPETLADAGVTDPASFSSLYWGQQGSTAALLVILATGSALFGGLAFGAAGPRRETPNLGAAPATG